MRLFVALELDERTRAALARAHVPDASPGVRVRRVAPRNLHLTLKFLGEVEEARLPDVTSVLCAASLATKPFDLVVRGVGAFPPHGAPRVIWAGCAGGAELDGLQRRVEDALATLGFPRDDRPFHPHVTLARIDGRLRAPPTFSDQPFGTVPLAAGVLFESRLGPSGSEYRKVAELPFGPGGR
jgi:2'-5' RNA ligase